MLAKAIFILYSVNIISPFSMSPDQFHTIQFINEHAHLVGHAKAELITFSYALTNLGTSTKGSIYFNNCDEIDRKFYKIFGVKKCDQIKNNKLLSLIIFANELQKVKDKCNTKDIFLCYKNTFGHENAKYIIKLRKNFEKLRYYTHLNVNNPNHIH